MAGAVPSVWELWLGGVLPPEAVWLAPSFVFYSVAQVVTFIPCYAWVRIAWPGAKDPWALADTIVSLAVFPLLAYSAISHCWQTHETVEARWRGLTPEGHLHMTLYLTRQILHLPVQWMQKMPKKHLMMMSMHHVLSIICYANGLLTGRMQFWGCLDGCCEMSTIFLNNLYMCKEASWKGKELKEYVPASLYALNGFLLWMSFLVFRLALFPFWLYHWYRDIHDFPGTWERSSFIERYVYPCVTLLLLVLSIIWFVPVTRGFIKALKGISGATNGKSREKPGKAE